MADRQASCEVERAVALETRTAHPSNPPSRRPVEEAPSPLSVEGLSFRYRSRPELALREVSFPLRPGELLLIAGSSGCGKTTLIRCINGLIPRSYKGELQGRVLVQGQDTAHVGSTAVKEIIQDVQPVLSLHGHIHESRAAERIGRTLAINPGSSYVEGTLSGVVVELSGKSKLKNYRLTMG